MNEQEQINFIIEKCKTAREESVISLIEYWRKQQEDYRKQLSPPCNPHDNWSLYSGGTAAKPRGSNLYSY